MSERDEAEKLAENYISSLKDVQFDHLSEVYRFEQMFDAFLAGRESLRAESYKKTKQISESEEFKQEPFAFFESPWWRDMNKQLCADGWPSLVVPLNCMIRDARSAFEAERERSAKLYERLEWLYESDKDNLDETEVVEGLGEPNWNIGDWIREAIAEYESQNK